MPDWLSVLDRIAGALVILALAGWFFYRVLKRSVDPGRVIKKLIYTLAVLIYIAFAVVPTVAQGGFVGGFGGIPMAAVGGLLLAIIWGSDVGALLSRPLENLFTGGAVEMEPTPQYSAAEALRKKGNYPAALAAVHAQLARFPEDFTGLMLLAEIHAQNLRDLSEAREIVERILGRSGAPPERLAYALNRLADWELQLAQDPSAARAVVARIIELFPDTQIAALAEQRLSHLPTEQFLHEKDDPTRIEVRHITQKLGLTGHHEQFLAAQETPAQAVERLEAQLAQYPNDWEAREELAKVCAESLQQVDRAVEQMEYLIAQPHAPAKKTALWLNELADIHLKYGAGLDKGRETLQRIIDLFPGGAAAEAAMNRLMRLKIELNARKSGTTVKLEKTDRHPGRPPKY
ncbi:MAG TPA: tetratricopeptide repeat protein [Verrucomicrobiota bacterium]|nr:tetratricopeptide repeat protein [Verrucomicrobiota bacterium]